MNDLAYTLKEIVEQIRLEMKDGFEKQTSENKAIRQSIIDLEKSLEVKYAKKASVNRLRGIIWGSIVIVGQYLVRMLLDLLYNHPH